jgi:hypothetical protein
MEGVSKETRLVKMTTEIHHTIKLIKCPVTFIRVKSKKKIVETFENFDLKNTLMTKSHFLLPVLFLWPPIASHAMPSTGRSWCPCGGKTPHFR